LPEEERRQITAQKKFKLLCRLALLQFLSFFPDRSVSCWLPPVWLNSSADQARCKRHWPRCSKGALNRKVTGRNLRKDPFDQLAVHVDPFSPPCASAPCLTGLAQCGRLETFFLENLGLGPWQVARSLMHWSFHHHGQFLDGPPADAKVIVAPCISRWLAAWALESDLVRRAVHHHLPDLPDDAAVGYNLLTCMRAMARLKSRCAIFYVSC